MSWVRQARYRMGTVWEMVVWSPDRGQALWALDSAFNEVAHLERLMSRFIPESQLNRIVRAAGQGPVPIDSDLYDVLSQTQAIAASTEGALDVTMGRLVDVWNQAGTLGRLPTPDEIGSARALVDYQALVIDPAGPTASLLRAGMSLDLGAIGKGFAVDRAVADLRVHRYTHGWVNAGGNVRFLGSWDREIPVRDPYHPAHACVRLMVAGGALSTSANYERGWQIHGRHFGHLLDPRTGWPASGCLSVTVLAPSAALADALSTACFILGPQQGRQVCSAHQGVEALWCLADGEKPIKIVTTPGLKDGFRTEPPVEEERIHADLSMA